MSRNVFFNLLYFKSISLLEMEAHYNGKGNLDFCPLFIADVFRFVEF